MPAELVILFALIRKGFFVDFFKNFYSLLKSPKDLLFFKI
ncbi:hypothetical protein JavanS344_0022 [Streptococcus satellite phage Javan344]|nr:hypothetical protein JavanS344_0022 [Streptococcus satellite phage Javan344]